jgi:hypothetical protein
MQDLIPCIVPLHAQSHIVTLDSTLMYQHITQIKDTIAWHNKHHIHMLTVSTHRPCPWSH